MNEASQQEPRFSDRGDESLYWRTRLVTAGLVLIWLAAGARLIQLQAFTRTDFAARAARQSTLTEVIPARPGEIVDRHGRLLATTVNARSVYLIPERVSRPWHVALDLAQALDLDADELFERISRNRDKQFLWVRRRITETQAERVRQLDIPDDVWGFRQEYLRRYPQGALAAHVLGLRDIDGQGRGGLEERFDLLLRGRDGTRLLTRDARGRVIDVRQEVTAAPQHGQTLVLSLDSVLQLYTEREMDRLMEQWKPLSACAIVMDPRTCDVLAMTSRPTFDPNAPADVPEAAWKNTALAAMFEPGSTFKPFVTGWAIDKGFLERDAMLDCENGSYRMGKRVLDDVHPYGELSVTDVLVKSSNIGMAKIGERLGNEELYRACVAFGFGSKTGSELPGELPGLVRPLKEWNAYSTGSIPMGHELAVTPLQMITAHAALANGGTLLSPRLVLKSVDAVDDPATSKGHEVRPSVVSHPISAETAHWLITGPMTEVVARGTGRNAKVAGYAVFGKTGTAQKADPETGGYSTTKHVSSFLCGAPSHDPQLLVLIMVDEPAPGGTQYGGSVAAPTAAAILEKSLLHLRIPHTSRTAGKL